MIMITPATVAFALLVDRSARAACISMTLAALGTPLTRWVEYAMFAAIMLCIAIVVFIAGLGKPRWPSARDWACCPDRRKSTVSGMEMPNYRRLLKACTAHAAHIATPGLAAADTRRVRAFP